MVEVLPLARILASKEAANRAKDRATIPVLRDALLGASAARHLGGRTPRKPAPRPPRAG